MALSDLSIKKAKPAAKMYKMSDGKGLFLRVNPVGPRTPEGSKLWRFEFRHEGKRDSLSLGAYPAVSLASARKKCDAAREQVEAGSNPSFTRKVEKSTKRTAAANSLEIVAREWHTKTINEWSPAHAANVIRRLECDIFPALGSHPVSEISAPALLEVLRKMEHRGAVDTANRVRAMVGQVFRYAIATGRAERDPSADLRGAMKKSKTEHYPTILDPVKIGGLLRAIDGYSGTLKVRCALALLPYLFVRPGMLRNAEWSELDLEASEWSIPAEKMKGRTAFVVPLSSQAVAIFREVQPITGHEKYVFPSFRTKGQVMSTTTMNAALRAMGFDTETEITGHGFRAMGRTILHETLDFPSEIIECQLSHNPRETHGTAYNRTKFIAQRHKMMQAWADHLDALKQGAQVIPFTA
jgi:integrase